MKLLGIIILLFLRVINSFYLPGLAPQNYLNGTKVELYVNALQPITTDGKQKLKSILPYSYYREEFHFCKPKQVIAKDENLGSALFGDRIYNSPFELEMKKDEKCKKLCDKITINGKDGKFINDRIRDNYGYDWLVDGLPISHEKYDESTSSSALYSIGFGLGEIRGELLPNFHTHFDLILQYHTTDEINHRIVGAKVKPFSRNNLSNKDDEITCDVNVDPIALSESEDTDILFTYSVKWEYSETPWATRWDNYLKISDSTIHWFSLINSSVIVLFLTGMISMILIRALHKDISRYNQIDAQEDIQEDFGWKLVHGDVFRTPKHYMLLSVMVGAGMQLLCMTITTIGFAMLGFLSPSMRGSLITAMVVLFMIFGSISGYTSSRLYKMFGGDSWKYNMLITAFLFPGIIFLLFIILNFFLIGSGSSAAVPFSAMFLMMALWFLISTPLSLAGSYLGLRKPKITNPVRTNQIPRQIPPQPLYLKLLPSLLISGALPFVTIFIELYFIMNSLWFHKLYYIFGFLFLVSLLLILTCSQVTILFCYFQLNSENYYWTWRSFLQSGSVSIYVLGYSIAYYWTKLQLGSVSGIVIYFGWVTLVSMTLFLITGASGFLMTLLFVRKIYGSIKID